MVVYLLAQFIGHKTNNGDSKTVSARNRSSLPADVRWGSVVMRDNRTPTDVCGEARIEEAESCYPMT